MRLRGERGSFVLQAVVLIMILALMGSFAIQLIMGRAVALEKAAKQEENRFLAQGVESRLNECLKDVSTQDACLACDANISQNLTVRGRPVTIEGSTAWNAAAKVCSATVNVTP